MVQNNSQVSKPPEGWSNQMASKIKQSIGPVPSGGESPVQPVLGRLGDENKILQKLPNQAITNCFPMDFGPDPQKLIDGLRNASGPERLQGLMTFQSHIDQMSEGQLKESQNYLVEIMSSPHNADDELLGSLLKAVNQELNSRHDHFSPQPFKPQPMPHQPLNINDISVAD